MEPPARPARAPRRSFAAAPSAFAPGACLLALTCLLAAACGPAAGPGSAEAAAEGADLVVSDAARVEAGDEGAFDELPGVPGFERLAPELQDLVLERVNLTRCDCGCPRHSLAHCLHQAEACEVALRTARAFVDDALALQLQTGGAADETTPEPDDEQPQPEPADPEPEDAPPPGAAN